MSNWFDLILGFSNFANQIELTFSHILCRYCVYIDVVNNYQNINSLTDVINCIIKYFGNLIFNRYFIILQLLSKCAAVFVFRPFSFLNISLITKMNVITFISFLVYVNANTSFNSNYQTFVLYNNSIMRTGTFCFKVTLC